MDAARTCHGSEGRLGVCGLRGVTYPSLRSAVETDCQSGNTGNVDGHPYVSTGVSRLGRDWQSDSLPCHANVPAIDLSLDGRRLSRAEPIGARLVFLPERWDDQAKGEGGKCFRLFSYVNTARAPLARLLAISTTFHEIPPVFPFLVRPSRVDQKVDESPMAISFVL